MKAPKDINILIACEESQTICKEFRKFGYNAFSCDLKPCSGGYPKWHIMSDCFERNLITNPPTFFTDSLEIKQLDKWDLIIAHPPCTYLSNVATRHHSRLCTTIQKINVRTLKRIEAMSFFMRFVMLNCEHIAIENPVGVMNTAYRKPDQIIDPYMFSKGPEDKENYVTKRTCLWLKNLPELVPTYRGDYIGNAVLFGKDRRGKNYTWESSGCNGKENKNRAELRSKTFPGIAEAIAKQWGEYLKRENT